MRELILILAFLAFPVLGWATACDVPNSACYVRVGASGAADGSDWTNAYTTLPATLTRGYTYYLASGTYAAYFANTSNSGTTTITIQAATAASHGTAVGWLSSYATDVSGPAVFNASTGGVGLYFNYSSDYWVVTGAGTYAGMGCGAGGPGCGLKIDGSACTNSECHNLGLCEAASYAWPSCPHDISVSYMEISGAGYAKVDANVDLNVHDDSGGGTSSNGGGSNFTLSHLYIHNSSCVPIFTERASNITVDHCYIIGNASTASNHGEGWADDLTSTVTVSNNAWESIEGSGFIVELDRGACPPSCTADSWSIYGNLFFYDNGNALSCQTGPCNTGVGDGAIACINKMLCTNWKIYQNDFVNIYGLDSGLCEDCTGEGSVASTWTVKNNLWWNNTVPATIAKGCTACVMTEDYNSWLNSATKTAPAGAYDVKVPSSAPTPFVAWTASPPNLHLVGENADWNNGLTLSAPYNSDPDGVLRGQDRQWDRGVFEYTSSLYPVINLRAVPH
jgi:hypothetical protein